MNKAQKAHPNGGLGFLAQAQNFYSDLVGVCQLKQ